MAVIRFFGRNGSHGGRPDAATAYVHGPLSALTDEQRQQYQGLSDEMAAATASGDSQRYAEALAWRKQIKGKPRTPAPQPLTANRELVEYAIATCPHKYKYSSGVIAFAEEDNDKLNANPAIAREYMAQFEALVFAGLPEEDQLIDWVLHTHEGNQEYHFIIPRINLRTGKAFNPHPPHAEKDFNAVRDYLDAKYQLASPTDPQRQRAVITRPARGQVNPLKTTLSQEIADLVATKRLTERQQLIGWLNQDSVKTRYGIACVEAKKDYLRVELEGQQKAIRLKGQLCVQPNAQIGPQPPTDLGPLAKRMQDRIAQRNTFNTKRYNVKSKPKPKTPAKQLNSGGLAAFLQKKGKIKQGEVEPMMTVAELDPVLQQALAEARALVEFGQQEQARQAALREQHNNTQQQAIAARLQQQRGQADELLTTTGITRTEQPAGGNAAAVRPAGQDHSAATGSIDAGRGVLHHLTPADGRNVERQRRPDSAVEQANRAVDQACRAAECASRAVGQASRAISTRTTRTRDLRDRVDDLHKRLNGNFQKLKDWLTRAYRKAAWNRKWFNNKQRQGPAAQQTQGTRLAGMHFANKHKRHEDDGFSLK